MEPVRKLLDEIHWHYASEILKAAQVVARSEGVYPVLVTSFKCTPDSYVIEYFKSIMDSQGKPYLILQLDDHDSSVGYETWAGLNYYPAPAVNVRGGMTLSF